jgi:hypothetical protein
MPDPFRAAGAPKSRKPPRAPDLPPLLRLRGAGLREDEYEDVIARWRAMTDAERFEAGEALDNLDDDELARQVVEMREEMEADRFAADALAEAPEPEPPKRRRRKST